MIIRRCRVCHLETPLGYQMETPFFSWEVAESKGKMPETCRIQILREESPLYDSGWIADMKSTGTAVEIMLSPRVRYQWKVSVKSDAGEIAESEWQWFETGKMEEPWVGKWIGCQSNTGRHPVFGRMITVRKDVVRARLYICGLGLYEASLNNRKVGAEYLTPGCNDYDSWLQYQTFDVTEQVRQGENRLEVLLGNGWYKGRFGMNRQKTESLYGDTWKLIAELHLAYGDGTEETIGTDENWEVAYSNITASGIYDGEQVDGTLEKLPVEMAVQTEVPEVSLEARLSVPVMVHEQFHPAELFHTPLGKTVLDLGQNFAGIFRLKVQESKGTQIRLLFGECLQDGELYRENLRTAKAEYIYISDGNPHVLEPHFTFYGYRYVQVEGISNLSSEDFTGLALYSELPRCGSINTGNEMMNRLMQNVEWGQKSNFIDIPMDCPQRDERMGWTGDAAVFAETACYQADSYAFFRKYLYDLGKEQVKTGGKVPEIVPAFGDGKTSAAWGDAACIIPSILYQFYGDEEILRRQYESMKSWVEYIRAVDGDNAGWRREWHYGDWLALDGPDGGDGFEGGTEKGFIASIYYRYSVQLLAQAAHILGRQEDEIEYRKLAEEILNQIRYEYFTPSGRCSISTQTALLLSLHHGISTDREKTVQALVELLNKNNGKLATGFVGTPLLCRVLTEAGEESLAFGIFLNEEYPGWLYEVKKGATTVWERWNSIREDGKVSENGMNSLNHYSYGSVAAWVYRYVAGLCLEPGTGGQKMHLKPLFHPELQFLDAEYRSAAGSWKIGWKMIDDNHIQVNVTVPFGCHAALEPPLFDEDSLEAGNPVYESYRDGICELDAGEYTVIYHTICPLKEIYNTDTPLGKLLANKKTKELLMNIAPGIMSLPQSMHGMSMRQVASMFGSGMDEERLAGFDRMLANI